MNFNNLILKVQPFSKMWFKQWAYLVFGGIIMSFGYVFFINPYQIIPGGVYGLGIVLHSIFPEVQVGTFGLCMDIPLLLIGLRIFGRKFGGKTIVVAVIVPLLMNFLTNVFGENPAQILGGKINLSEEILLACLFGGVFIGSGLGLILKAHATSGGTDIIAMIVSRYMRIPISRAILMVDSCVVVVGILIIGDWLIPLYSLVTIYVISTVIDYTVEGANTNKIMFILSAYPDKMEKLILQDLDRSATYIKSRGMYTKADREMIFIVVSKNEVAIIRDYVKIADPQAFIVIANAHEIYGEGFQPFTVGSVSSSSTAPAPQS